MNEDLEITRAVSVPSIAWAGRIEQHMPWESLFRLMKHQVAVRIGHRGFTMGTSRLVSLAAFCAETAGSGDKGTAVDIVYLVSKMSFDVVSHRTLIWKQRKCRLGEGMGKMDWSWLNCWTQR